MALTTLSVRNEVTVAGLTMAGTPAIQLTATFSSIPQTGKLNALIGAMCKDGARAEQPVLIIHGRVRLRLGVQLCHPRDLAAILRDVRLDQEAAVPLRGIAERMHQLRRARGDEARRDDGDRRRAE